MIVIEASADIGWPFLDEVYHVPTMESGELLLSHDVRATAMSIALNRQRYLFINDPLYRDTYRQD